MRTPKALTGVPGSVNSNQPILRMRCENHPEERVDGCGTQTEKGGANAQVLKEVGGCETQKPYINRVNYRRVGGRSRPNTQKRKRFWDSSRP